MELANISQRRFIAVNVLVLVVTLVIFFVVKENYKKWLSEYAFSLEADDADKNLPIGSVEVIVTQDVVDGAVDESIVSGRNMNNPLPMHRFSSRIR